MKRKQRNRRCNLHDQLRDDQRLQISNQISASIAMSKQLREISKTQNRILKPIHNFSNRIDCANAKISNIFQISNFPPIQRHDVGSALPIQTTAKGLVNRISLPKFNK